jgi:glycosyltransferase involved in cell wall biosynthesis
MVFYRSRSGLTLPVRKQIQNPDIPPLLSVFCWSFNNSNHIRQCIESVLDQKTSFPIEIIIHDDSSADETLSILHEYTTIYPALFRNIVQDANQWSQGLSVSTALFSFPLGRYVALTHADDAWDDPDKLEKQVAFLEANSNYVFSFHDFKAIDESGCELDHPSFPDHFKKSYSAEELSYFSHTRCWIPTVSLVYRNYLPSQEPPEFKHVQNGDVFIVSLLAFYGAGYYHDNIRPALYRIHQGGTWSTLNSMRKIEEVCNTYFWLYKYNSRLASCSKAVYFREQWLKNSATLLNSREIFAILCKRFLGHLEQAFNISHWFRQVR